MISLYFNRFLIYVKTKLKIGGMKYLIAKELQ